MAIFNPEGQSQPSNEEPPKLFIPEQYGEPKSVSTETDKQIDDEKREEEMRRIEEDKSPKFTDRRGKDSPPSMDSIPIIGATEAKPATTPKIILGGEQQPAQPEQKPSIEVVSNFGDRRTPEQATYGKNMVQGVAERRDVREQIKNGEIPTAVELSRLDANERPEKKETQETVIVRTGEQQEQDRIKAEAEAKKKLEDRLIELKGMRVSSEQERATLVAEAAKIYEQLKGGDLKAVAEAKARQEAAQDGLRVMTKQEFLDRENDPARMEQRMTKIREGYNKVAVDKAFHFNYLTQEGKTQYGSAEELKTALENKRAELEKNGISIPEGTFYELVNQGYKMEDIKIKRGMFGFGKAKGVEIPTTTFYGPDKGKKEKQALTLQELANLSAQTSEEIQEKDKQRAQEKINETLVYGQRTWKNRKQKSAGDVLDQTIGEIQEDRKPKPEQPKPVEAVAEKPKPKFEIFEFGNKRTPEQQKEMEKIRKQVEADIERKKKAKKELADLIKLQKSGKLLTARQLAHLRAFATEEMKEAA